MPTTQVSLLREHTAAIHPPRALWVPFAFGRPFGVPDDAEFQSRVLRAALELLDRPAGPVLEDFPEDAPDAAADVGPWACPLPLPDRRGEPDDARGAAFLRELEALRPWYDLAVRRRGRTTASTCGLPVDALGSFLVGFLGPEPPAPPKPDLPPGLALKLAAEDLKAVYFEAVTVQPGGGPATADSLAEWFWGATEAGALLFAVRAACASSDDPALKAVASFLIVPQAQRHLDPGA